MAARPTVRTVDPMTTALITGGSRGLGLALARELAEQGWRLVLDARGADALQAAAVELGARTEARAIAGDVSDERHRLALAAAASDAGGLDAVVHNASMLGASPLPPLASHPVADLRRVYDVNVVAPIALTQLLVPHLRPGASLVFITSDAAVEAYPGWGGYGSSKAALEQAAAVLAVELADHRVYRVDPGDMRTTMHQEAFPGEDIGDRPLPEISVGGLVDLLTGDRPSGRYLAREVDRAAA
jgi:NAD(P)-dependent dehydrogenase (short-subunit alcohol dehydrogenase family)